MMSFDLHDVGLVHLNVSAESERARWIAQQLPQSNLSVKRYCYDESDDIISLLGMVQVEVRCIVLLFSQHTPPMMGLAATTVMQNNSDWVIFVRCDEHPRQDILADREHVDLFGDETAVAVAKMANYMRELLNEYDS